MSLHIKAHACARSDWDEGAVSDIQEAPDAETWVLAASGYSWHGCGLQVLERPHSKSQDSTGLKLFAKVQKGVYVIVTVLEIDSFYLHWCWNNVFLQGETNV